MGNARTISSHVCFPMSIAVTDLTILPYSSNRHQPMNPFIHHPCLRARTSCMFCTSHIRSSFTRWALLSRHCTISSKCTILEAWVQCNGWVCLEQVRARCLRPWLAMSSTQCTMCGRVTQRGKDVAVAKIVCACMRAVHVCAWACVTACVRASRFTACLPL